MALPSSSPSSSYLSVLRIGPTHDNVSATLLKNAILDHFHKQQQQQDDHSTSLDLQSTTGGRFQVSNRYFQAQLLLQPMDNNNDSTATNDNDNKNDSELYHKEDGIILVFDAARSNPDLPMSLAASFDSLDPVHAQAEDADTAGDLLRLCVGVTVGQLDATELCGKEYEQEYSRRILWCLDRGYEYVEADLSQTALVKGHDSRDKEGFARIVEAIAGTVWSSAVMSKTKTQQLKQSYQETRQEQEINKEAEEEANDSNNPYIPPDPSLLGAATATTQDESSSKQLQQEVVSDEDRLEQAREALLSETAKEMDTVGDEEEENKSDSVQQQEREQEHVFDQLEGALKQAASIREMSQSGKLTDEERRQRAGDAAVLLMNLMSSMGLDGDEEDEEDEEDGSLLEGEKEGIESKVEAEALAPNTVE